MHRFSNTTLIGLVIVLLIVAGLLYALAKNLEEQKILSIVSFEQCVAAGYPIMESYPEQCRTPDGRLFVREVLVPSEPQPTDCVIGGCSAQMCGERSEMEDLVSTCEYRAEYACYNRFSACERQENGQCGWTETPQLRACLSNPPQLDESMEPQPI